jgi:DNA end-binding protein Ku
MAQQVWRGSISFGLVNVGVKAFSATRDHKVRFHQIDRASGSRIGYDKVAKSTGEKVDKDDIALGYEVEPGRYVTFDPDEVAALRPRSTRTVDISDFVDLAAIDPVYYEKTYWLLPADEGAEKAYGLLAAAMEAEQRVGIGMVVMRSTQYLAAIRPLQGGLAMSTMRFADEVVDLADLDPRLEAAEPSEKELELARQIITGLAAEWDPTQYHDTYTEELRNLIREKAAGNEITEEPETAEAGAQLVDLMAALEASVAAARAPRSTTTDGDAGADRPA